MKRAAAFLTIWAFLLQACFAPAAHGYTSDYTVPKSGGCPQPNHWDVASSPLNRRWSISLPLNPSTILTVAPNGSSAQLDEIEQAIQDSFRVWTGITGTTLNAGTNPNALGPLARTADQNACENDQGTNPDGLNTICFNQASSAFATGVLAFTRTLVADAPGESLGSSGTSAFAGQILDADIAFRPDGQATFATPAALASPQAPGAYDLESLLAHELGHFFGMDHSGVRRAVMFPFAPAPGTFLGDRPTPQAPDGPLADDDRTGLRALYPDPNDTVDVGVISGRILPANPFAVAAALPSSPGRFLTGIFGTEVVALDAETGAVVAATLGGWACDPANPPAVFDGSFLLERLPAPRNYKIYVEPFDGLVQEGDISEATSSLCRADVSTPCTVPRVNTNFTVRVRPPSP